jgi:hypothetical protein
VLAPIFLWVGINQPSFRTGLLIGLGGLALAPWFSIAGWMFGNSRIRLISPDTAGRNAGGRARTDSAPLGRAISWVRAGPSQGNWKLDGPSLGKAGLIYMALLALAVLAGLWWFLWQLDQSNFYVPSL